MSKERITIEFDKYDLDSLIEIYKSWNSLSSDPEDSRSMTDHCHQENDWLHHLIIRIEDKLNE